MRDYNMKGKVAKMRKILQLWLHTSSNLIGRIIVAKTLGLSLLTYPMMNLDMPKGMLLAIEDMIYEYIWKDRKKTKIKKLTLLADYKVGGLRRPDLITQNTVWKMCWITRLLDAKN